jgi:hypothetical protein
MKSKAKKSSKMDEGSLGGLKPSLSVYLNASTNVSDNIGKSNAVVKNILKDMEKIKRSKHPKSEQACVKIERLVYFIVQTLRRMNSDHLMQTTVIWVLITLLRLNYNFSRKMMVAAGVPGALYDIMSSHTLSGSTRQYASELCLFLCSDDPNLDPETLPNAPPNMGLEGVGAAVAGGYDLPSVSTVDKVQKMRNAVAGAGGSIASLTGSSQVTYNHSLLGGLDSTSISNGSIAIDQTGSSAFLNSSVAASAYSGVEDKGALPFVPYVIDEKNLESLNQLFDDQVRRDMDCYISIP